MDQMTVPGAATRGVMTLTALVLLAGACSGDDDDQAADRTDVSGAPVTAPAQTARAAPDSSAPADSEIASPATTAPATSPPTVAPVDTGVPGLDSDDAFCSAWSRFGGSWQLLVQAGAAGDPGQVARLEVIASTIVQDAYDDVFDAWPASLESEREVVADGYFGAFQRRSADAAAALAATGASDADIAELAQAWDAALAQYDPATAIDVPVPPDLQPIVDQAANSFGEQRVPLQSDPSMVITVETPLTDEMLATACPDQGWIVGQDVSDDAA
jgi:hypothetical protein